MTLRPSLSRLRRASMALSPLAQTPLCPLQHAAPALGSPGKCLQSRRPHRPIAAPDSRVPHPHPPPATLSARSQPHDVATPHPTPDRLQWCPLRCMCALSTLPGVSVVDGACGECLNGSQCAAGQDRLYRRSRRFKHACTTRVLAVSRGSRAGDLHGTAHGPTHATHPDCVHPLERVVGAKHGGNSQIAAGSFSPENVLYKPNARTNRHAERGRSTKKRDMARCERDLPACSTATAPDASAYSLIPWLSKRLRARHITIDGKAQRGSSSRGEAPRVRAETRPPLAKRHPRRPQTTAKRTVGPSAARMSHPPGPQMAKRRLDSAGSAETAPCQHSRTGRLVAAPTPPRLA